MATRFVNRSVHQEQSYQSLPEVGIWAGSALVDGYCLRRVEEQETTTTAPVPGGVVAPPLPAPDPLERLDELASHIASDLRTGLSEGSHDDDKERTVAALDLLIAGAVERRLDHLRDEVDGQAWIELGEYLTWWVVKGYALRAAEC
ncbi:MAG: hypothetical protein M3063_11210 [Actinomycetota bacterium]|nr:hypothetical protein [Actinomycetota bacterium]